MTLKSLSKILALSLCALMASFTSHADTSGKTQYPIVLVHGHAGFDRILADYFYGVKHALRGVGATAYTPQVPGWNSDEVRGEILLAYIEELLATTGANKVNLIGHSQGGSTSRYVAAVRPDLIASITTIATPHYGSPVADLVNDTPLEGLAVTLGNAIARFEAILAGEPDQAVDTMATIRALNTQDALHFNAQYPQGVRSSPCKTVPRKNIGKWWWPKYVKDYSVNDGARSSNGIRYYSWSANYNPVFNSNVLDPADAVLAITSVFAGADNDGLVPRCSTHFGQVIRDDYVGNHADEINGMFGLRGLWTTSPVPLYVEHARRLKKAGL